MRFAANRAKAPLRVFEESSIRILAIAEDATGEAGKRLK